MTLGESTGIRSVVTAPIKKEATVVTLRPAMSYRKPISMTVGIATIYPYAKLFAAIFFASSALLS